MSFTQLLYQRLNILLNKLLNKKVVDSVVDYLCGSTNHDVHDAMRPRMRLQIQLYFKTKHCFALQVLKQLYVYDRTHQLS